MFVRDGSDLSRQLCTDGGASFDANVRVTTGACPCGRPGLGFGPAGEVLAFYRHVYADGVRDMAVAVSRDRGVSFAPGRRSSVENWHVDGCPDSGVTLARRGRRLYAAWLGEATPARIGVLLSWTDDGSATWAPATKASQDLLDANYPGLAGGADGRVALVFQGRDPRQGDGWGVVQPFVLEIDEAGRFTSPQPVPVGGASALRPALTLGSGGQLFTTWTTVRQGVPDTQLARGQRLGSAQA